MTNVLERRVDGSIALFIDEDLQFDSNDERIYHEALALPALAIANSRIPSPLKVLVIGGGDGLIARELFKSPNIASVDLVDYDPEILALARKDIVDLNENSLSNARLSIHVRDAWDFVDDALKSKSQFDLIIVDLTVADTVLSARFHSIEWYSKLSQLASPSSVLSINSVSPQATPKAYWSIFNSIIRAGLSARPYHVHIPSFAALGYGQDWGFFLASAKPITINEINNNIELIEPRYFLQSADDLHRLFLFPEEIFTYQPKALPALAGSDILLHYFSHDSVYAASSSTLRNSFTMDYNNIFIPEPDSGKNILPPELSVALARSISPTINNEIVLDPQVYLQKVLDLMPSLQKEHTPELVADFLADPTHFLEAIDLPGLVTRLLKRAAELPAQVVAELELLRDKLQEWAGDHFSLLGLGQRVITILTLVIVAGNLFYPDVVYGKGEGHHAGTGHHGNGYRATGYGGAYYNRGYGTTGWNNNTTWTNPNNEITRRRVINTNNRYSNPPVGNARTIPNYQMQQNLRPFNPNIRPGNPSVAPVSPNTRPANPTNQSGMLFSPESTRVLTTYLSNALRNASATKNRLLNNKTDLLSYAQMLAKELSEYQSSTSDMVTFGSHKLPRIEAIRRTKMALKTTKYKVESVQKHIEQLPLHIDLAQIALTNLNNQES